MCYHALCANLVRPGSAPSASAVLYVLDRYCRGPGRVLEKVNHTIRRSHVRSHDGCVASSKLRVVSGCNLTQHLSKILAAARAPAGAVAV